MKTIRRIRASKQHSEHRTLGRPNNQDVPEEIFEKLAAKYKKYIKYQKALYLEGDPDDQDLVDFLNDAREYGLDVPKDSSERPIQISVNDLLEFDEKDSDNSEFVQLKLNKPCTLDISPDLESPVGFNVNIKGPIKRSKQECISVCNLWHLITVRGSIKEAIEKENFNGLKLIPLSTTLDNGLWPKEIEQLFLIWSDCLLPPVNHRTKIFTNPYNKKKNTHPTIIDGYKINPQLNYKNLDNFIGTQDVARSCETFGETIYYSKLVYSQKIRQFLKKLKIKTSSTPVIIQK
ncbi:hypothetical protein LNTAR_06314 [Lentisphaera araneosa HTCC2155]|uniref:Uncharacterized protein n=1 Tax=Lentisphaera araneosa HTCC2155 TaxID=313628 RepID=A6DN89_9BACT|nr:hypothetical protein [Lentisphaera araneosa]EDM26837.1 hypothetical protein LNTAR_06314 [Lentisphaera araneosa HTCC2155]